MRNKTFNNFGKTRDVIKKLFGISLACVLGFSLTACSENSSVAYQTEQSASQSAQLIQVLDDATTRSGFKVSGPITGGQHGWAFGAYLGDIDKFGYVEEEYFIEGTAQHYQPVGELTEDGKWTLEAESTTPYKTRMIVRRPADPAKFNGTVVVEWANVSAGFEISMLDTPGLYKEGFAYVDVLPQMNGLYGFAENPQGLIPWDSQRYGSLSIPDDGLSYDIFTQAARAIGPNRPVDGIDPMGGLKVEKLFAVGASQSGSRVLSYANGIQPIEKVFDAILSIVSAGRGTDFQEAMAHVKEGGETKVRNVSTKVRDDINCKVFVINSQTESIALGKLAQPDTDNIRSWQVAGASHFGNFMDVTFQKLGRDGLMDIFSQYSAYETSDIEWTDAYEAALVLIQKWIDNGVEPPHMSPLAAINIVLGYHSDQYGNAKGGVRLPELEVPTARYVVSIMSGLSGYRIPFTEEELLKLYPTHQDYVDKIKAAAKAAEQVGIILPYRAEQYIKEAEAAPIPVPPIPNLNN